MIRLRAIGLCHRGFTLMELLVTIILMAAILSLLAFPMMAGFAYIERGAARADAQAAGRRALEAMARELSEAIYVFDIPADGSMIAFVLPSAGARRVSPPGPGLKRFGYITYQPAEIEKAAAIRYWRVLTRFMGDGVWQASEVLARTEVPNGTAYHVALFDGGESVPLAVDARRYPDGPEPFDDSNLNGRYDEGEAYRDLNLNGRYDEGSGYNPDYSLGNREKPQPLPVAPRPIAVAGARLMSSITPNELGYEVPLLRFQPELVKNDTLRPAETGDADSGVYRGRFPLWQRFTQGPVGGDPFGDVGQVRVYQRANPGSPYQLAYLTRLENGRVRVLRYDAGADPSQWARLYDAGSYPARDPASQTYAFGIDLDRGLVIFSFPQPSYPSPERLEFRAIAGTGTAEVMLKAADHDGDGDSDDPNARIIPASETIRIGGEIFERVPSTAQPRPGQYSIDYRTGTVTVDDRYVALVAQAAYMWRNNSDDDLVVATYRSKGLIGVTLTMGKRTRRTNQLEAFRLSTQVKVGNALR